MFNSKLQYPVFLSTVSLWWGLTFFADILIAPSIFRVVENFFNAGDLAMVLFSRLNALEMILSTLALIMAAMITKRRHTKLILALCVLTWAIALFYFAYLIPKIMDLTELWKKAEAMGVVGIEDVTDVQQEHQYFHRIYIIMDSAKLIILSFIMSFGIFKQDSLT